MNLALITTKYVHVKDVKCYTTPGSICTFRMMQHMCECTLCLNVIHNQDTLVSTPGVKVGECSLIRKSQLLQYKNYLKYPNA